MNTVQFSNHTGYGGWTGTVFPSEHVAELVDGIAARGVLPGCDAVLSGYMGSPATGAAILDAAERVRALNPQALYCCDPVMGDVGRGFFVKAELYDFIRGRVVPRADIVTPNQFELEFLADCTVSTLDDALGATAALRALGPRIVLLTSLRPSGADPDEIEMLVDSDAGAWLVSTPRLPLDPMPNGAGDAVAALFLGKLLETGNPEAALRHASAAIFAVFTATAAAGTRELALIAAQDQLVAPARVFPVQKVR